MTRWTTVAIGSDGPAGMLADASAKATLLLLLSWLIVLLLRRHSAALRHRLWALALCGSIALPLTSWLFPGWRLPVFAAPPQNSATSQPASIPVSATSRAGESAPRLT